MITSSSKTETSVYVEATCGNKSALVSFTPYGVRVICQNAMHQVWRGAGKAFADVEAALAGYKSGEMKSIISAAAEYAKVAA